MAKARLEIEGTGGDQAAAEVAKAQAAAARLSAEIEKGGTATARYAAQTKLAIDAARQHGNATDAQRAELDRLEAELDQNILKAREFANEMKDQRELIGGTDGVAESFGKGRSKLLALRDGIGSALAAAAAFREAYSTTREVVDFMNESLGINIDKWIQETPLIRAATEALAGYNETAAEAAAADQRYAEAQAALLKVRTDLAPAEKAAAAERAQQAKDYDELIGKLDPVIAKERERAAVLADLGKWLETGAISQDQYVTALAALDEKAEGAKGSIAELAKETEAAAPKTKDAAAAYAELGDEIERVGNFASEAAAKEKELAQASQGLTDAKKRQEEIQKRLAQLAEKGGLSQAEAEEQVALESELAGVRAKITHETRALEGEEANLEALRARARDEAAKDQFIAEGRQRALQDATAATEDQTAALEGAAHAAADVAVGVAKLGDKWIVFNNLGEQSVSKLTDVEGAMLAAESAMRRSAGTYSEGSEAIEEVATQADAAATAQAELTKETAAAVKPAEDLRTVEEKRLDILKETNTVLAETNRLLAAQLKLFQDLKPAAEAYAEAVGGGGDEGGGEI